MNPDSKLDSLDGRTAGFLLRDCKSPFSSEKIRRILPSHGGWGGKGPILVAPLRSEGKDRARIPEATAQALTAAERLSIEAARQLLESEFETVERCIASICRKPGLSAQEREEFRSYTFERLARNEYAVIRKFRKQSSLSTYLSVAISRFRIDFLVQMWGKWRPSATAKALGELAIRIEELLHRDGYTQEEGYQLLNVNEKANVSREEYSEICSLLPPARLSRRPKGDEALASLPAPIRDPEKEFLRNEAEGRQDEILSALGQVLQELPPEDQLLIRLYFHDDQPAGAIARVLGIPEKAVYRRLQQRKKWLRSRLKERGVEARDLVDWLV